MGAVRVNGKTYSFRGVSGSSSLVEDRFGLVHSVINLVISNNLPRKALLMHADLDVPSLSSRFTWLSGTDPPELPLPYYSFNNHDPWLEPLPREEVINDHLHGGKYLKRGDVLTGLLLGSASPSTSMPASFAHRSEIGAELTLWDQFDSEYSLRLRLRVDRSSRVVAKHGTRKAEPVLLRAGNQSHAPNQKRDGIRSRDHSSAIAACIANLTAFSVSK